MNRGKAKMAELPERKLLKEVLTDLKAKTIRSKSSVEQSIKVLTDYLSAVKQKTYEIHEAQKAQIPDGSAKLVYEYTVEIENRVTDLMKEYLRASDDDSTYIKWLEKYSTDLDKTLYGAIEAGTKKAEEQIKEQNELMSKKKEDYVA
jgi:hypothetical protein